jgi:hypothetical protein
MMQEMLRKCTKPTYTINNAIGGPKARWKDDVESDIRRMGVNGGEQVGGAYPCWVVEPQRKKKKKKKSKRKKRRRRKKKKKEKKKEEEKEE